MSKKTQLKDEFKMEFGISQLQIKSIIKIAIQAGKIAMLYFGSNSLNVQKKSDDSPLTIADSLISELIFCGLQKIAPNIPIICEEGKNRDCGNGVFWLIDPIDGTSSFANNDPEFTINIALIANKKPVFGLVFAPAIAQKPFYYLNENGELIRYFVDSEEEENVVVKKRMEKDFVIIASKRSSEQSIFDSFACLTNNNNILTSKHPLYASSFWSKINKKNPFYILIRRVFLVNFILKNILPKVVVLKLKWYKSHHFCASHPSENQRFSRCQYLTKDENCHKKNDFKTSPHFYFQQHLQSISILKTSSSLKFLYLIEGKADLYLHLRQSMEWDIAAGQALLEAGGGRIANLDGTEFLYQKKDLVNQPFVAIIEPQEPV